MLAHSLFYVSNVNAQINPLLGNFPGTSRGGLGVLLF